MALTIKQLNGGASFLLTFESIEDDTTDGAQEVEPFRVLLDPSLEGPSNTGHAKFSSTSYTQRAYVSTLRELPEPDLVIISSSRRDYCNEATLRQLAPHGTKTLILAEPAAAKLIKSWRYFDEGKVLAVGRWQDPRKTGRDTAIRVPISPRVLGGDEGQVTVSFISQTKERKGNQAAIGITYQPAPSTATICRRPTTATATSSSTPLSGFASRMASLVNLSTHETVNSPILPPLPAFAPLTPPASPIPPSLRTKRSTASLSPHARDRSVSIIFSPHGTSYSAIETYATSHLVSEAALPLTALLHCFDTVSQPWWLGGNVSGLHDGQDIVAKLGARAWISMYDGEKRTRGLAKRLTRRTKYNIDEVREIVNRTTDNLADSRKADSTHSGKIDRQTEVMALKIGEEVALTSEGVWAVEPPSPAQSVRCSHRLSIFHILNGGGTGERISSFRISKLWSGIAMV